MGPWSLVLVAEGPRARRSGWGGFFWKTRSRTREALQAELDGTHSSLHNLIDHPKRGDMQNPGS